MGTKFGAQASNELTPIVCNYVSGAPNASVGVSGNTNINLTSFVAPPWPCRIAAELAVKITWTGLQKVSASLSPSTSITSANTMTAQWSRSDGANSVCDLSVLGWWSAVAGGASIIVYCKIIVGSGSFGVTLNSFAGVIRMSRT